MSTRKISETNNFGERLRSVRLREKLSQEKFAKKLGVSQAFLSHLEVGRNQPTAEILNSITTEFAVSGHWLLTGEGAMHGLSEDGGYYRVAEIHRKITPDQQRLLDLLEGVPLDPDVIAELGRNADAREMMENYIRLPKSRQKRRLGDVIADREELEKEKD